MMTQTTTIHERTTSLPKQGNTAIDTPVVPGVKVLGIESKNGRKYPIEVMRKALEKYEGAIVNIDHPAGSEPRSYEDRFGRLTNARMEADGIYADLAYNPKHPLAEGFQWWVQNDPKAIGLSHNAQAKTKMNQEGVEEIEEIVKVDSVDLVAEPATTAGLMECVMRARESRQAIEADTRWDSSLGRVYINLGFGAGSQLISEKVFPDSKQALNWVNNEFKKAVQKKNAIQKKNEKNANPSSADEKWMDNKIEGVVLDYDSKTKKTGPMDEKITEGEFKKGNRMNVKESLNAIEKVISDFQKNIGKAFYDSCKAVPRTGVPKEWHSSLDHGLTASSHPWFGVINEAEKIAKKMYKDYVDRVEDHRAEAKKRGMSESKPTKKLNVTEAKKRKAYKRMLVSEAIKEILTIRKGV
jgi:hypothetical protein